MRLFAGWSVTLCLAAAAVAADEVAVTVYNNNLGVISETRTLQLERGVNRLAFTDVPSAIDPASVRFDVEGNRRVTILEQNYAYDLVSPEQMYQKYIDQPIELVGEDGVVHTGKLLAFSGNAVTLQDAGGRVRIVSLDKVTQVNFPELPDGLITRPTLFWLYQAEAGGAADARVSYQTSGLSWNAEYVGVLNENESRLDLSGWSSITNNSGKTYTDAKLKLIAGDIGRAQRERPPYPIAKGDVMLSQEAQAGFQEQAFFEYHMYTLPRTATVADREIKQISLFEPASTQVKKVFKFKPEQNAKQVEVDVTFTNSEQAGLGMPIPAGRVRIFKADADGSLVLLGEDLIEHTPRNEEVDLRVGHAFDIAAEERLVNQTRVSQTVQELEYEVEFRNRKEEMVTIQVEKKLWGMWEIARADFQHRKKDAMTLEFSVEVPADQTVVVKYTVRITQM